jgi:hypothetical protein
MKSVGGDFLVNAEFCNTALDPSRCPDFCFAPVWSHIKASQSSLFIIHLFFRHAADFCRWCFWVCCQRISFCFVDLQSTPPASYNKCALKVRFSFVSLCWEFLGQVRLRSSVTARCRPPSFLLILLASRDSSSCSARALSELLYFGIVHESSDQRLEVF